MRISSGARRGAHRCERRRADRANVGAKAKKQPLI
jgi:hypothetical protein